MGARLIPLLQLWALLSLMLLLPFWFLNGLVWPALSPIGLLILCATVGAVGAAIIGYLTFERGP
jgi:hypothetical protein